MVDVVHATFNPVFVLPLLDCTVRQPSTLSCLLSWSHCTSMFISSAQKKKKKKNSAVFVVVFAAAFAYLLKLKCPKRSFAFDSSPSQLRKIWDQSAQGVSFLGSWHGTASGEESQGVCPRVLVPRPFLFIEEFKIQPFSE